MKPVLPVVYAASDLGFDQTSISVNALKVVDRLQGAGFDGYLVGGCVRDLLLDRRPKDFDVTTNASPEQVKKLFDRARIIGRRFKLIHVSCGRGWRNREVIEVATYRAAPQSGIKAAGFRHRTMRAPMRTGRILDDNVYGSIDADATRRDFTINALYYDPNAEIVLDFVRGIEDIRTRTLSVIGDVPTRFAEDPVRMLRVVRFQAKLQLKVAVEVTEAIKKQAFLLADVPAARLFEEVLKLFHYQSGCTTWQALCRTPLARILFPQTFHAIDGKQGHRLEALIVAALKNTDARVADDQPVIAGFIFAVLLWGPFRRELHGRARSGLSRAQACALAAEQVFTAQERTVSAPWRARSAAIGIWELQPELESATPKSVARILQERWFRAAYDFLLLRSQVGDIAPEIADWWTHKQEDGERPRSLYTDPPAHLSIRSDSGRQYRPGGKFRRGQPGARNKPRSGGPARSAGGL